MYTHTHTHIYIGSKWKRKTIELDSDTIEIEISYQDIHGNKWHYLDLIGQVCNATIHYKQLLCLHVSLIHVYTRV